MILVAQISDLHMRPPGELAYDRVDTAKYLRDAVAHLNALSPRPDAVIVTGDIGDKASPEEYAVFNEIVADLQIPWWPIPGNHDGPAFWDAFPDAARRRAFEGSGYSVDMGNIQAVLFDTSVEGRHHGEATGERIAWLRGELLDAPQKPTLLFMHHPPFETGIGHMDQTMCRNAGALANALADQDQILAIGCGHIHRVIVTTFAGHATIVAPSPAHAVTLDLRDEPAPCFSFEPPGILIHRIAEGADGKMNHVVHQSFIGEFDGPYRFY